VNNIIETVCTECSTVQRIRRITGKNETPFSLFSILINMFGNIAKGWNYEGDQLLWGKSSVPYTIIRPGVMCRAGVPAGKFRALVDNGENLKVSVAT